MRGVQASCPACGGPVQFKISSALVAVCGYCRTVVARTDRKIEDLGKVAALVETASPLHLGLKGTYQGKSFLIVGRVQYRHAAGGVWDEWYAAFANERWGWLAEAMGRFYITFEKELPETVSLPAKESLSPGERVRVADQELTVAEVGQAEAAGAEGEMPFVLHPGESHDYADLYGAEKRFVTLDYGTPRPVVFVGKEVTLADVGLADAVAPVKDPKRIGGLQVNCPQCGGPLNLKAPDQTQRVICPQCSAVLDAAQGNLRYLETLDVGREEFEIPVGTEGTWNGVAVTVIGAMRRSVTFEKIDYYWSEYLLYAPQVGFRWLVESDRHWSYVEPISPGDVDEASEGARRVTYQGRPFRLFQQATATVRYVVGEFYWKVTLGESVFARDFIAPPQLISIEHSTALNPAAIRRKNRRNAPATTPPPAPAAGGSADEAMAITEFVEDDESVVTSEVNYSLSTYVTHDEVEAALGVTGLSRGWKVAPNQPVPVEGRVFKAWAGFLILIVSFYFVGSASGTGVDGWLAFWAAILVSVIPAGALYYRHTFEVSRWRDSEYTPYTSSDDSSDGGGDWSGLGDWSDDD